MLCSICNQVCVICYITSRLNEHWKSWPHISTRRLVSKKQISFYAHREARNFLFFGHQVVLFRASTFTSRLCVNHGFGRIWACFILGANERGCPIQTIWCFGSETPQNFIMRSQFFGQLQSKNRVSRINKLTQRRTLLALIVLYSRVNCGIQNIL